jgi:tetrahydromethanopterin S-methyltransferase subunit A
VFAGSTQSSPVIMNVTNAAGADISAESRQNADGSITIDMIVERKMKGVIASGAMDRVMAGTYGARRRGFA